MTAVGLSFRYKFYRLSSQSSTQSLSSFSALIILPAGVLQQLHVYITCWKLNEANDRATNENILDSQLCRASRCAYNVSASTSGCDRVADGHEVRLKSRSQAPEEGNPLDHLREILVAARCKEEIHFGPPFAQSGCTLKYPESLSKRFTYQLRVSFLLHNLYVL